MERFLKKPNLPQSQATFCALSEEHPAILEALARRGLTLWPVTAEHALPSPIAAHADMLLHHLGENRLLAGNYRLAAEGERFGFCVQKAERMPAGCYPGDISLNALRIGPHLFGLIEKLDLILQQTVVGEGIQLHRVPQGYSRCSVCVVSEKAAITADLPLAGAMEAVGIEVLRVPPGGVELPGYSCGFLGGAAGLLAPDCLAFTGTLQGHPAEEEILQFLYRHKVSPLFLTDGQLLDVGGILPLKEQV